MQKLDDKTVISLYLFYFSMPDLIIKCKSTHWKEQLWNKIVNGTSSFINKV